MSNKKANATINATLTMNEERNGVEVAFTEKPSKEVLSELKSAGFHWHNGRQIWYAKVSDSTVSLAKSICGVTEEPTVKVAKALSSKKTAKKQTKAESKKAEPTKASKLDAISVTASMVKEEVKAEVEKPTTYEELLDMLNGLDVKAAKEAIQKNIELLKAYQNR